MKVLVVSDTHGDDRNVIKALNREAPVDALLHLGDTQEEEDKLHASLGINGIPVYIVKGNCDYFASYPPVRIVTLGGHRIMMAHGHTHYVNFGTSDLVADALANDCDIAIYGHTHRPEIDDKDPRILVLNPGSIAYPRQRGRKKTYIILTLENDRAPKAEIRNIQEKGDI